MMISILTTLVSRAEHERSQMTRGELLFGIKGGSHVLTAEQKALYKKAFDSVDQDSNVSSKKWFINVFNRGRLIELK